MYSLTSERAYERQQAERLRDQLKDPEVARVTNGVLRWVSVNRAPPEDVCTFAHQIGVLSSQDLELTLYAREREVDDLLAHLRSNPPTITHEQRMDARAAHGPGVTVVNYITGQRFTT